jgi:hypothetical protein
MAISLYHRPVDRRALGRRSIPKSHRSDEAEPRASRPAIADALRQRIRRYLAEADGAYATRTIDAIESDFGVFVAWCRAHRKQAFPAIPRTLTQFVEGRGADRAPSTIRRGLATLGHLHRALGYPDPTRTRGVVLALRKIQRAKTTRPERRTPLRRSDVETILLFPVSAHRTA